jgi:hypothetical protein
VDKGTRLVGGLGAAATAAMVLAVAAGSPAGPASEPARGLALLAGDLAPTAADHCERLARRSEAALAPLKDQLDQHGFKLPALCAVTQHGTWTFAVERAVFGTGDYTEKTLGVALALVHVDAEGRETSILPMARFHERLTDERGAVTVNLAQPDYWGATGIDVLTAFDYDGDGDPEVLLAGIAHLEGPDASATEAWTFKEGAIVPFAPLARLDIAEAKDLDGDGRPEIVTAGPYDQVEAVSGIGASYPVAPPFFALHALPGGAFSANDDVARAYTRSKCPRRPALDLSPLADSYVDDAVAERLVCAKVWGARPDEVTAAWRKVCGGADASDGYHCPAWPNELAAIAPPFVL